VGRHLKLADAPREIASDVRRRSKKWRRVARRLAERVPDPVMRVVQRSHEEDVFLLSAGLAFYALVSVAPLLILVMWAISLVLGDQRVRELSDQISRVAPKDLGAGEALRRVAQVGTSVGVWAIVTALWPATAYGAGLRRAFDRMTPKSEPQLEGLWGRGLLLLAILPVFILGSLIGAYAGTKVLGEGTTARVLGLVIALGTGFVGAAAVLALIYRIFPARRMSWSAARRATIVAATGISVLAVGFIGLLSMGLNFQRHYLTSGLAGVVLLGLWLFLSNLMVLVAYRAALDL
jgi:membrane protein